jgi:hypothetical protein
MEVKISYSYGWFLFAIMDEAVVPGALAVTGAGDG